MLILILVFIVLYVGYICIVYVWVNVSDFFVLNDNNIDKFILNCCLI